RASPSPALPGVDTHSGGLGGQGAYLRPAGNAIGAAQIEASRVILDLGYSTKFVYPREVGMSGHSKWSTIKHKKGALDAKRGRIFTKIIKEITVAAKLGGGNPDGNPRLRAAVAEAKANNMPADNIKRAIQKGTGELPGVTYEEKTYEGYGPGGAAVLIQAMTDNANRTTSELRHLITRHGGNLAEVNAVAWMFERKGYFVVPRNGVSEDRV